VQSVHIDGWLHGVSPRSLRREDVTDIVAQHQDISIKMQGEGPSAWS